MSLQSHAVLLPYRDTSISNAQLHRINRLPGAHNPIVLRWIKRGLVVTNAAERKRESSKEVSLNNLDLMALEFGRLLGESKEKTISKVVRRKMDPGATYLGIEKQVKKGKESMSKADYGIKIESPKRAAANNVTRQNGSTSASGLPSLASPPVRQKGSSINFPQTVKAGGRTAPQHDTQEILDESLLRKPSLSQSSTAGVVTGLPTVAFTSHAMVGSRTKQGSMSAKERSIDHEMLRKPSMIKENKERGGSLLDLSNSKDITSGSVGIRENTEKSSSQRSQPELSTVSEDNESVEVSKQEFQHLPDESFNPSPAYSLPNLASPPVRQNNSLDTSLETVPKETRVKLSSPERSHPGTEKKAVVFQPGVDQPGDEVTPSPMLQSEGFTDSQDDESLEVSKLKFLHMLDAPSGLPYLASPPSRHKGSLGTFSQPTRAGTRATRSSIKSHTDETVDESLLRKPTLNQTQTGDMASTSATEANTSGVFLSKKMQSLERADESIDDDLLRRPMMTKANTEIYVKTSNVYDVLQQNGLRMNEEKAFLSESQEKVSLVTEDNVIGGELLVGDLNEQSVQKDSAQMFDVEKSVQSTTGSSARQDKVFTMVLQGKSMIERPRLEMKSSLETERPAQLHLKLSQTKPSNGLDSSSQVSNKMPTTQSGGVQDVDRSPGMKGVKAPVLKKPVRVSLLDDTEAHASEVSKVPSNTSQEPESNSEITQQPNVETAVEEKKTLDKLDIAADSRTLQTEHEVEEAPETQILTEPISMEKFLLQKTLSEGDPEKHQETQEQMIKVPKVDQTMEVLQAGASADCTESVSAAKEVLDNILEQANKMVRKPTQPTYAELSFPRLQRKDLGASDTKWQQAKEDEEKEWARADALLKSKEQVEVKLIGSNSAGLFASFGCLVGFLPSFELSPKRGLVDFSSWTQQKGIDLQKKSGLINGGVSDASQSAIVSQNTEKVRLNLLTGDLNDLRNKYKEDVSKLMSTMVGEKARVIVKLLDKSGRRLKFSEREADPSSRELAQKKADLMAELKVGDIVTCEVKSITPIGVFVELDGVAALIHHSEVSWNARVDPTSLLSIGEVIKARVCRLDRTLQRINLSLKQMQPDPLKLTLESVVGDSESDASMHELEAIESEAVIWPELEDLIKKLEQMEHISCVSKGRCLHSAALAPTFQVFLSAPQIDGYKLLARFGNKIQEVLVKTTLDRDKMKECIRLCTFAEV